MWLANSSTHSNVANLTLLLLLLLCSQRTLSYHTDDWNYWGPNGEYKWDKHFKDCRGRYQSPVNIETQRIVRIPDMHLSFINYDINLTSMRLINNGHGVKLTPAKLDTEPQSQCFVSGSAFYGEIYRFLQLHFHWRNAHSSGSEHAIDGDKFTMEMHMVHQNIKYDKELLSQKIIRVGDAFTVFAVFFNESNITNPNLDPITEHLEHVLNVGDSYVLHKPIPLTSLMPDDINNFYRYSGSYTTPGCQEIVTWILFPTPLPIHYSQMQKFRDLISNIIHQQSHMAKLMLDATNQELIGYYRHIQELGSRRIYAPLFSSAVHVADPPLWFVCWLMATQLSLQTATSIS